MTDLDELITQLEGIEELLRDRAYGELAEAAGTGDPVAIATERKLAQARRSIEKAIHVLQSLSN